MLVKPVRNLGAWWWSVWGAEQNTLGITGGVMWDSGVVLAKLLEHAADTHGLQLRGKKCVELGAGCGLTG